MDFAPFSAFLDMVFSQDKKESQVFLGVFVLLFLSSVLRDFTYDEAWTYSQTSVNTAAELISYKTFTWANNHILNSLYFKCVQLVGLTDKFFFRLLSLISFILYGSNVLRISKLQDGNLSYVSILVVFAPFIDYFSLGRGYALALATLVVGLRLVCEAEKGNWRSTLVFTSAIIISCLSVFSFVYPAIALCFIWGLKGWLSNRPYKQTFFAFISFSLAAGYVGYMGNKVMLFDPFIPGSLNFIKNGTISSLVSYQATNIFPIDGTASLWLRAMITLVSFVVVILGGYRFWQSKMSSVEKNLVVLIALICVGLIAAHLLIGAPYPMGRGSLYLSFLALFLASFILSKHHKSAAWLCIILLCTPSFVSLANRTRDLTNESVESFLKKDHPQEVVLISTKPFPALTAGRDRFSPATKITRFKTFDEYKAQSRQGHMLIVSKYSTVFFSDVEAKSVKALQGNWVLIEKFEP